MNWSQIKAMQASKLCLVTIQWFCLMQIRQSIDCTSISPNAVFPRRFRSFWHHVYNTPWIQHEGSCAKARFVHLIARSKSSSIPNGLETIDDSSRGWSKATPGCHYFVTKTIVSDTSVWDHPNEYLQSWQVFAHLPFSCLIDCDVSVCWYIQILHSCSMRKSQIRQSWLAPYIRR